MPVAGRYAIVYRSVAPGQGAMNSAQRVAAVGRRCSLTLDAEAPGVVGASVLLVDDQVITGWTMTRAAAALREAGADVVLPLALATQN